MLQIAFTANLEVYQYCTALKPKNSADCHYIAKLIQWWQVATIVHIDFFYEIFRIRIFDETNM